jgi:3-oxoacyl-[acyl-carrier protein] reductase
MSRLSGQVAIVTAAAGAGIGQAMARRLAAAGARVVVTDAHARRTHEVAEAIAASGAEVLGIPTDVTSRVAVDEMVRTVVDRWGRLDVLVNNAGFDRLSPVWELDDETWFRILNVNLTGAFFCTRAVLPQMILQKKGVIVNLSSIAAYQGSGDGEAAYSAAKAGVMGFTRAAAAEVGRFGIRVVAVAPSVVYNPFLDRLHSKEYLDEFAKRVPLGRLGNPDDVASLVAFLCSEDASYITGEIICISGGSYMPP